MLTAACLGDSKGNLAAWSLVYNLMKTLILGGARSGKTAFALRQAEGMGLRPIYLATGFAGDAEMADRIARHKAERGAHWTSLEEQIDIPRLILRESHAGSVILVDCLTLWLSNLLFAELDLAAMSTALVDILPKVSGPVIFVSNEVGLGIVPDNALSRQFRDAQGRLNQQIAKAADRVVFIAAGLPMGLKGETH